MQFTSLEEWLNWQEGLNPKEIDLGLDRVKDVLSALQFNSKFNCPLITVAGTNGKGSVVAMLEAIATQAGLNVCCYTSPHIHRYNERIRSNAKPVSDEQLCESFQRIDQARGKIPLTYFEFGTLAAIDISFQSSPDLVILEVGLGGRLDAVNVMDADVAILTTVDIDHIDWLGDNRESIGYEKAGVFRSGKLAVCGPDMPDTVIKHASAIQARLQLIGPDIQLIKADKASNDHWQYCFGDYRCEEIKAPSLSGDFQYNNAALAISALYDLQQNGQLKADNGVISQGQLETAYDAIASVQVQGRFQLLSAQPDVYVDVAHNLQAAMALKEIIDHRVLNHRRKNHSQNSNAENDAQVWCVLAMMSDKNISGVMAELVSVVNHWVFTTLPEIPRAAGISQLNDAAKVAGITDDMKTNEIINIDGCNEEIQCTIKTPIAMNAAGVDQAIEFVLRQANQQDTIIIAGSFYTVSAAQAYFSYK